MCDCGVGGAEVLVVVLLHAVSRMVANAVATGDA
jgi:hypothetical protein